MSKRRKLENGGVKAVVLIGGPSKGTRFRPLSLESPKPLFSVAGKPLISWQLEALLAIPNLMEVLLLGFYDKDDQDWKQYIDTAQKELNITIRHLQEETTLGTGGGLLRFKNEILSGNPQFIFVLHCDICCAFPFLEILETHKRHGKECTILGKRISRNEAHKYGCLPVDPETNEILHYAEKPETFVSDIINCGVYLFDPNIYSLLDKVSSSIKRAPDQDPCFLRLEQDLFMNISGEKHVFLHETHDFWLQVKSAGIMVLASEKLLGLLQQKNPSLLANSSTCNAKIEGNVLIDPSAKIHPSAKLGPNVCIGANVVIGAGVRIRDSVVLENVEIKDRACILYSIVGWQSSVGEWARLEGVPDYANQTRGCGVTILGTGVTVFPEIIVRKCIVLPHKELKANYNDEILL